MKFTVISVITVYSFVNICKAEDLTYEEIMEAGSGAKFTVEELQNIKSDDLEKSLIYLGKDPLQEKQARVIWKALVKVYDEPSSIPDETLRSLGWVIAGIPDSDFRNITLSDIDTITIFGQYYGLNISKLAVLAEVIRNSWSSKQPEDYTYYDLDALGYILCGFNRSEIERIHPDSYKEAALAFSSLKNCSTDVLQGLATLAVSSNAFGDPSTWTMNQVKMVGCVIAGLEDDLLRRIPSSAMEGFTTESVKCLTQKSFKAMTVSQLEELPVSVADSLSSEQRAALDRDKLKALSRASYGLSQTYSAAISIHKKHMMLFIITPFAVCFFNIRDIL